MRVCTCVRVSSSPLTELVPFYCRLVFHGGEGHHSGFQFGAVRNTAAVTVLV